MKPRALRLLLLGLALTALSSCKHAAKHYPDSAEGLKSLIVDLRAGDAKAEVLKLPDAKRWFTDTFDAAAADRLVPDLEARTSKHDLGEALEQLAKKGKTEIAVERFTDKDDPMANGNESFALKSAKQPLVLYSVRVTPPGETLGIHMYSFVYVDHGFRFVGPMTLLHPAKAGDDPVVQATFELRNKDREEYFKTGKLPE